MRAPRSPLRRSGSRSSRSATTREAEKFFTDYEKEYGDAQPDPYAIYGYETMALALATLEAVGDKANDRKAVCTQLLTNTKDRESALGVYSIDENGDTTLTDYGLYTIKDGAADLHKGHQGPGRLIA